MPKNIWRRALVFAIPKPRKTLGDQRSHRPIYLLCVPFKILERFIYAFVESIIGSILPQKQEGFRHWRSTVDQITSLTQVIEDRFLAKNKARAVFVDLTAAYDFVCYRGLTCKLLRLLPGWNIFCMMMVELISIRSFTPRPTTGLGCWGNNAIVNSHSALVHSTAEYCVLAWCRSAHTRLIDPTINDALRIVTGCLRGLEGCPLV